MSLSNERLDSQVQQWDRKVVTTAFESNASGEVVPILQRSRSLDIVILPKVAEKYRSLRDMKDPDTVTFQGKKLIYFSAGTVADIRQNDKVVIPHETWDIGLLSKTETDSTYQLQPPITLVDEHGYILTENSEDGNRFCAPGMQIFHEVDPRTNRTHTKLEMYVHTDCFTPGNRILQFQSDDGITFKKTGVA